MNNSTHTIAHIASNTCCEIMVMYLAIYYYILSTYIIKIGYYMDTWLGHVAIFNVSHKAYLGNIMKD